MQSSPHGQLLPPPPPPPPLRQKQHTSYHIRNTAVKSYFLLSFFLFLKRTFAHRTYSALGAEE